MDQKLSKITVRLPVKLVEAYRKIAEKDERSLQWAYTKALESYAKRRGVA